MVNKLHCGLAVTKEVGMCCSCSSENQAKFNVEMNVHFPGLKNASRPSVWLFPEVLICLNCGSATFSVPSVELALLAEGTPKKGAAGA
jgi:hypothetical protein